MVVVETWSGCPFFDAQQAGRQCIPEEACEGVPTHPKESQHLFVAKAGMLGTAVTRGIRGPERFEQRSTKRDGLLPTPTKGIQIWSTALPLLM